MLSVRTLIESRSWVEQLPLALQMELGLGLGLGFELTQSLTSLLTLCCAEASPQSPTWRL